MGFLLATGLRRQVRSLVVLALIVGFVVAVVLGCAMASRRTSSAIERFLDFSRPSTILLEVADDAMARRIAALPIVEDSTVMLPLGMTPMSTDTYMPVLADREGRWLRAFDRVVVEDGALPALDDAHALVITEQGARLLGVSAGDPLVMLTLSRAELSRADDPEFEPSFDGPRITFVVAAVVRVPPTDADPNVDTLILTTPAFLDRFGDEVGSFGTLLQVRLEPGLGLADLAVAVRGIPGGEGVVPDQTGSGGRDAIDAALGTVAFGLAAVAIVVALAGSVAVGQGASRVVLATASTTTVLRALGMRHRHRVVAMGGPAALATFVGVACGSVGAILLAPHVVGDLAQRAEVDPGLYVDWAVMVPGAAVGVAVLCGSSLVAAHLAVRRDRDAGASQRRALVSLATRGGLPAAAGAGLMLAYSRADRPVPSRQALIGGVAGVVGAVAVAVFGGSLDRALEEPYVYGWNWDASIANDWDETGALASELDQRGVTDAAMVTYDEAASLDGQPLPGMTIELVRGSITPALVRGELPDGPGEVLVGERTLDDLQLSIGDTAELGGPDGQARVRIAGTAVLPAPDDALPVARGVIVDPAASAELGLADIGIRQLAVRVDGDPRALFADLAAAGEVAFPTPPAEVQRLDQVRSLPVVLGGLLGTLAAVMVGHALLVTVGRRRQQLAVLRAVGFTRRQLLSTILVQPVVIIAVALSVGLPLGIALGRVSWRIVTDSIGLPFLAATQPSMLVAVVAAVVAVVLIATLLPLASAIRLRTAAALRAE